MFYLVPRDGYGLSARKFFDRFYPNHVKREADSLEALMAYLAAQVDSGVTHIREVVIVAHGNPLGLLSPIVGGVTATSLREFKYITAFALALLQNDLRAGKFDAFKRQRQKAVSRLQNDSWITIRACNFGRSREAMYALYSFFGGRANVYAPMIYQLFGDPPIMFGMRLENRLRVHEHLVKQHFFPKDVHTPDRKDAVVRAMVDPGRFSEPFPIASRSLDDTQPDQSTAYEQIIDQLNAGIIGAALTRALVDHDFVLTAHPRVTVVSKNTEWRITDAYRHEDTTFEIQYTVYERIEISGANRQKATLYGAAQLTGKVSGKASLPMQLFLSSEENAMLAGKELTLAAYSEAPDGGGSNRTRFDAVLQVLRQNAFADAGGTVDIKAELKDSKGIELSAQAVLRQISASGPAGAERIVWSIVDGPQRFRILLEHPLTGDGFRAHTITVYDDYADQAQRLREGYLRLAYLGSDPDAPGTELAAYFDRFTIEELVSVLEYLRAPFKPGHGYYLHQVQQALCRRKGFRTWLQQHSPLDPNSVLPNDPYTDLSLSEQDDYRELSYVFDFNQVWAEVKSSNPTTWPLQTDLFDEEDLAEKLQISDEAINNRTELPEFDPDSPGADVEALRAIERIGFEKFFEADKAVIERLPESSPSLSCAEFAAVVAKWQEVKDLEPEGMQDALEREKLPNGKSYFSVLKDLKTYVKAWFKIVDIKIPGIDWVGMSKKDLAKLVLKKVPFFARMASLQAILEVEFVFTIPFAMWMDFVEAQQHMRDVWFTVGRITVIRQWLRRLIDQTYLHENDFPSQIVIDVTTPVGTDVYYLSRYKWEQFEEGNVPNNFIPAPDRFKDGFDGQAQLMDQLGDAILRFADESIGDLLRESDLDACKIEVLRKAGVLDVRQIRALIIREFARQLLDKLPTI
ncbi:MAG: hypothetical protein FIA97_06500 [Methylococcaceae bacterium]|nr:hypothetical protein [Methylococcaceae bacterium]